MHKACLRSLHFTSKLRTFLCNYSPKTPREMFSAAIPGLVYRKEDDSTDAAYKKYMNDNAIEETSTLSGFTSPQQNKAINRFIPSAVSMKQLLPHMLAGHFEPEPVYGDLM